MQFLENTLYGNSSDKRQLISVWQVTKPAIESPDDIVNVLDEIDLSDPAAVSSTVATILTVMNAPTSTSVITQDSYRRNVNSRIARYSL